MSKVIIVSNRLPVKVQQKGTELQYKPSEGGLATGLSSVVAQGKNLWVGWPGLHLSKEECRRQVTKDLRRQNMHPVFLSKADITDYYEGFSNETLWPSFHYFNQYVSYNPRHWEAYVRVNRKFLDEVLKVANPGDTIWVHDYQLMLLPQLLRQALPDSSIGFFLHIPFPSYEVFRLLPWRKELIEGLLGADLIGFHTYDYMRHFLSSASRISGCAAACTQIESGNRTLMADAFPMGIDYEKFAGLAQSADVKKREALYRENLKGQRVVLSIDRLDYTKGIPERLQAFEQFLEKYPEYQEKVTLLMLVVPSRDQVPQYQQLKEQVDELVGRINANYRTIGWTPIQYFYQSFPAESLSALYRLADVALVTPMRDGMNLVAKEYVASRTEQTGVLILSEMAGAAQELFEAILINPNNQSQVVEALHQALQMPPAEQKKRMAAMQQTVRQYHVHHWVELFMSRLELSRQKQQALTTTLADARVVRQLHNRFRLARHKLIFLDYDGTLAPFTTDPEQAKPDREILDLLRQLGSQRGNRVVLVSGRDRNTLTEWFGELPIDLVAEHGVWMRCQKRDWKILVQLNNDWKGDIRPVLEQYVRRTPGSFIEEKGFSLVWHYRKTEPGLAQLRVGELKHQLTYMVANQNLQVLEADKVVEVKNLEVNKGRAAMNWLTNNLSEFVMAIGDDFTDEDMFRVMPEEAFTIKVGSTSSAARYFLPTIREVRQLLQNLPKGQPVPVAGVTAYSQLGSAQSQAMA